MAFSPCSAYSIGAMGFELVVILLVLLASIVAHEMAHGFAADHLGDPTPRLQGRLSPNPAVHIDPIGSVVVPGLLFLSSAGFIFGWAKPVVYNPFNLRDQRYGELKVAAAGPATNVLIALLFSALIRASEPLGLNAAFVEVATYVVFINLLLALFNLLPVPPLDGSKILPPLLPPRAAFAYRNFVQWFEQYGFLASVLFIFLFITLLWPFFAAVVARVFMVFTGQPLFL